jgi:NADH-quinone oxidoreductase subunit C
MEKLIEHINSKFIVLDQHIQRENLAFVTLKSNQVVDALTCLRDTEGYRHLVMISTVDYIEKDLFQLTYFLHNYHNHTDIGVRVEIDRDQAAMDSIHHLWATAQVYQRELKEMYGIDFPGSPHVDEPMMLERWDEMPPMRKEFKTKEYSAETFFPREGRQSFDPKTIMEEKLYPLETEVKNEIKQRVRANRGE